jgi:hypothetical protein
VSHRLRDREERDARLDLPGREGAAEVVRAAALDLRRGARVARSRRTFAQRWKSASPAPRACSIAYARSDFCAGLTIGTVRKRVFRFVPRRSTVASPSPTSPRLASSVSRQQALVATMNATRAARSAVSWANSFASSSAVSARFRGSYPGENATGMTSSTRPRHTPARMASRRDLRRTTSSFAMVVSAAPSARRREMYPSTSAGLSRASGNGTDSPRAFVSKTRTRWPALLSWKSAVSRLRRPAATSSSSSLRRSCSALVRVAVRAAA